MCSLHLRRAQPEPRGLELKEAAQSTPPPQGDEGHMERALNQWKVMLGKLTSLSLRVSSEE